MTDRGKETDGIRHKERDGGYPSDIGKETAERQGKRQTGRDRGEETEGKGQRERDRREETQEET